MMHAVNWNGRLRIFLECYRTQAARESAAQFCCFLPARIRKRRRRTRGRNRRSQTFDPGWPARDNGLERLGSGRRNSALFRFRDVAIPLPMSWATFRLRKRCTWRLPRSQHAGFAWSRSKPRKVIVLDCDNTLWQGICGEGPVRRHRAVPQASRIHAPSARRRFFWPWPARITKRT